MDRLLEIIYRRANVSYLELLIYSFRNAIIFKKNYLHGKYYFSVNSKISTFIECNL